MKIGGFVKNSFVDYPGNIACTIFTVGCNFRCWYCHNSHIIKDVKNLVSEDEIFEFLNTRKSFLDAVVISGGEPTLQSDLISFIKKIKCLGFKVKLDTNGSNPKVLQELINLNLLDYVAMDIKAPLEKYKKITIIDVDTKLIKQSIDILTLNKVNYEFRTTFSPDLSLEDLEDICKLIKGANLYSIQKYNTVEYNKVNMLPRPKDDYLKAFEIAKKYIKKVNLKGID